MALAANTTTEYALSFATWLRTRSTSPPYQLAPRKNWIKGTNPIASNSRKKTPSEAT